MQQTRVFHQKLQTVEQSDKYWKERVQSSIGSHETRCRNQNKGNVLSFRSHMLPHTKYYTYIINNSSLLPFGSIPPYTIWKPVISLELARLDFLIKSPEFILILQLTGYMTLNVSSFSSSSCVKWGWWFVSLRIDREPVRQLCKVLSLGPGMKKY